MRQRIDGVETRQRILEAACAVFAEKGFRDATVAGICKQAKANTALINYHFRDKESLYVEVWKHSAARAQELYPFDGGVPADASARERLRGLVYTLLRRMTDSGRLGYFHRLFMMEMTNPTGFIDDVIKKLRQPFRDRLTEALRELLGPKVSPKDIEFSEMSVISQCRSARFGGRAKLSRCRTPLTETEVEALAEHITEFSLAGIEAVRARAETSAAAPHRKRYLENTKVEHAA